MGASEPTDNTPTIISKNAPPPVRPEANLAESLRGRLLAHFELLEPIGVGGMAAVIRARDTELDRIVALKVLPPEMAVDPEHVRRFHQEARSAAKLDHENIARVFYCGQDQGLLFIAFEFVEGENLRTILERRGQLPVTEAIHYILQIATGLAHASQRGVVHRDIKPSNIIVSSSGRAKLVDMGLARSLGPQPEGNLTQSGVTLGTFDYISPEQALEPRDADIRSDIYSLGCTLYHMLTGQPPVPEGTAAKKLHHHQHVPPVDPRQLNPAIPDDMAVVLGRMMAKDAKERYQQPEHLVQHLLALAQKVGAPASNPDGVLFVDAPLPSPPQLRPAFLMAAAVVLLVAFIVFFGPSPGPTGAVRPPVARNVPKGNGDASLTAPDTTPGAKSAAPVTPEIPFDPPKAFVSKREPPWHTPENAKDLADYLQRHEVARIMVAKDLDLEGQPLLFQGRSLEIKAADLKSPPTLRLVGSPGNGATRWVVLTVQGSASVKLTGLRFEINAAQADIAMTGLLHEGTGEVTVAGCEFAQKNAPDPMGRSRLSAVRVHGGRGEGDVLPRMNFLRCYFAPGQEAITLAGAAEISAKDCAFAPQSTALFHLRGSDPTGSRISVRNCSAFLTEGAAFRVSDGLACMIDVHDSIFSRLETEPARPTTPALILHTGPLVRLFAYEGNGNCYHNLKVYWQLPGEGAPAITTWKDFINSEKYINEGGLSFELTESPWEAREPLSLVRDEPRKAFRLRTDLLTLRRGEEPAQHLVGIKTWTSGPLYETALPRLPDKKAERLMARRIVDPGAAPAPGIYATLKEAIASAKSGDEILLRTNSRLRLDPIWLYEPNFTLTLQADRDYHPVLSLNRQPGSDTSLFHLYDGQLTLRGLGIHLEPMQDGLLQRSIATLLGPARCVLQNCLVTMAGGDGARLAVITLAEPSAAMKMESLAPRSAPEVSLDHCFIRGEGDLLDVRASRPFGLEVKNSLVVLRQGSFLVVKGAAEPLPAPTAEQLVELTQVTAYLGEHLLSLKSTRSAKGLAKTEVKAHHCLFASGGGKSLVHLEGMENEDEVRGILAWSSDSSKPNVYSGFSPMLDQMPRNDEMMLMPFDRDRWLKFTEGSSDDRDKRYRRVEFMEAAPASDVSWAKVAAASFRLKPDDMLPRCGAEIETLLKLFDESRSPGPAGREE